MKDLVAGLSSTEIIDLNQVCNSLISQQISDSYINWLVKLDTDIGMSRVFKWAGFIGKVINVDFRQQEFKKRAKTLSSLLQTRFSQIGLDISMWSPVFFYLGMIYQYSQLIGFVKLYYGDSMERIRVMQRLDSSLRDTLTLDPSNNIIFIDTAEEDPLKIVNHLVELQVVDIKRIEIYKTEIDQIYPFFNSGIAIHIYQYGFFKPVTYRQYQNIEWIAFW